MGVGERASPQARPPRLAQRLPANQRATEREERFVDVGALVVTDAQAPELVEPGKGCAPRPTATGPGLYLRKNSRSDAFQAVIVMEAAEPSTRNDAMRRWQAVAGQRRRTRRFVRQSRTQGGMWSFTVVVGHPLRQDPPQMPLVERNHPVETFAPSGPDESLAVPVGLRCRGRASSAPAATWRPAHRQPRAQRCRRDRVRGSDRLHRSARPFRNCWIVHSAVGCRVRFQCTIRRVVMSRMTKT